MGPPLPALTLISLLCAMAPHSGAEGSPGRASSAQQATPTTPPGNSTRPASSRKVLHLHVRGDLDSLRLARDFAETLAAARADGVEVVLLELSGDRWRADVVHAMAKALREAPSPGSPPHAGSRRVLALLDDEVDRRVGFGQASLALLADACTLTPRTNIVFDGADDLRSTASPETDWERVDRELQGLIYLAAKDRQADVLLAAFMPKPSGPLWAAPAPDNTLPWRLMTNRPDHASATLLVPAEVEGHTARVQIDGSLAARLGITTCNAKDAGQLLASQELRARPIIRKELVSGLNDARTRLNRLVQQLDDGLRAITIDLAQASKLRGQDAPRQKREAGDRSGRAIAEAERRLLDAEAVMTEYPELLAGLPPGRTPVGQDPEKHPMLWRWRFQDLRNEIDTLRASAESLSRTP